MITLDEAEKLAMETDYAVFASGEEINTADAGAFFLEGYKYAKKEIEQKAINNYKDSSIENICIRAGLNIEELKKNTRKADYAQRRQAIMVFMHKRLYKSLADSGKLFVKDHATVSHSLIQIKNEMELLVTFPNIDKSIRLRTYEKLIEVTKEQRDHANR